MSKIFNYQLVDRFDSHLVSDIILILEMNINQKVSQIMCFAKKIHEVIVSVKEVDGDEIIGRNLFFCSWDHIYG